MGYVNDHYVLFSSESNYLEWMEEDWRHVWIRTAFCFWQKWEAGCLWAAAQLDFLDKVDSDLQTRKSGKHRAAYDSDFLDDEDEKVKWNEENLFHNYQNKISFVMIYETRNDSQDSQGIDNQYEKETNWVEIKMAMDS